MEVLAELPLPERFRVAHPDHQGKARRRGGRGEPRGEEPSVPSLASGLRLCARPAASGPERAPRAGDRRGAPGEPHGDGLPPGDHKRHPVARTRTHHPAPCCAFLLKAARASRQRSPQRRLTNGRHPMPLPLPQAQALRRDVREGPGAGGEGRAAAPGGGAWGGAVHQARAAAGQMRRRPAPGAGALRRRREDGGGTEGGRRRGSWEAAARKLRRGGKPRRLRLPQARLSAQCRPRPPRGRGVGCAAAAAAEAGGGCEK